MAFFRIVLQRKTWHAVIIYLHIELVKCIVPENIDTPIMGGISCKPPSSLEFPFLTQK